MINDFCDLDAWKTSELFVLEIYKIVKKYPSDERFGLIDQLRRASSSVTANIAEGFGRYHFKDKVKFYYQARGSVKEVQSFLLLSKDLKYINKNELIDLWKSSKNCELLINGLIRSIEKQI